MEGARGMGPMTDEGGGTGTYNQTGRDRHVRRNRGRRLICVERIPFEGVFI